MSALDKDQFSLIFLLKSLPHNPLSLEGEGWGEGVTSWREESQIVGQPERI